jgi:hypothetical protein
MKVIIVTRFLDFAHCPEFSVQIFDDSSYILDEFFRSTNKQQTNSVALSPRANYTDWSTATCRWNLMSTFVDRGVSRGQRGSSPTVVNLSFLDRFSQYRYVNLQRKAPDLQKVL